MRLSRTIGVREEAVGGASEAVGGASEAVGGASAPLIRALKIFRAVIRIRADAVCCIHVSTVPTYYHIISVKSVNHYQSFVSSATVTSFKLKLKSSNFLLD